MRALPVVALMAVLVAALAFALSRRPSALPPSDVPAAADASPAVSEPTSVFHGVELVEQDPDGTLWRLKADEGTAREAETTGTLRGVHVEFQRRGRRVEMEAGEADVERGEEVRLSEGVEIAWEGYAATVSRATYLRGQGRIRSEDPVELTGPGLSIEGRGVEVDVEGRVARVLSDVRTVIQGFER